MSFSALYREAMVSSAAADYASGKINKKCCRCNDLTGNSLIHDKGEKVKPMMLSHSCCLKILCQHCYTNMSAKERKDSLDGHNYIEMRDILIELCKVYTKHEEECVEKDDNPPNIL